MYNPVAKGSCREANNDIFIRKKTLYTRRRRRPAPPLDPILVFSTNTA